MKNKHALPTEPLPAYRIFLSRHKRLLSAILLLAVCAGIAQSNFIAVVARENGGFFMANYGVAEENFDHPRLQLLRQREHLDQVIAPGTSQLDKTILLRAWAHRQWTGGGTFFYYPPWDAVEILDLARKHANRGFCAQYAIVFLQACLSVGLHARYIDLPGHFTVAVWSDDYDKWVVMDPFNDVYYEYKGAPLSGFELYDAYLKKNVQGIEKVASDGERKQITLDDISVYRMYSIDRRNNHLTEPIHVQVNGTLRTLALAPDYRQYPLIGRDSVGIGDVFLAYKPRNGESFPNRKYTRDPDDFKDDINQTIIYAVRSKKENRAMKVILMPDDSPTFRTFVVNVDNTGWREVSAKLVWNLKPGINRLSARILTRFGWLGHESHLTLFYKPPWPYNPDDFRESSGDFVESI